ncbi:MAG: hypothetical protein E7515_07305 [Ruminococcaceae bacterium]|jgi:hypothetical protein|nr:hypothetical protein [Oscillospiraceae bacterium]
MEKEAVLLLKINDEKWIKKLKNGEVCFNRSGFFIEKALKDNNNEQGDLFEGVFAHIHKGNTLLVESISKHGSDLEIIDDGNYVFLRRKSSRNRPIFCMYGITIDDLVVNKKDIEKGTNKAKAIYNMPTKMYEGFLDNSNDNLFSAWGFYASAGFFQDSLKQALKSKNYSYLCKMVSYDLDLSQEFYIEPTPDYPELFHKRKDLSYQHEVRYVLPKDSTSDKIIINMEPISNHSAGIAKGNLLMEFTVIVEENNN